MHSVVSRSYKSDARVVTTCLKIGKAIAALDATYSSTTGTVVLKTHLVQRNLLSTILMNKASTLYHFALGNFGSLVVLSGRRYHPFSHAHTKLGLKRKTKCLILRSSGSLAGTPCYRLDNCTGTGRTCRRAKDSPSKSKPFLSVDRTVTSTKLATKTVSCVGMRNANAPDGSTSRKGTVQHVFSAHVPPFDSIGTFVKRALKTSRKVRTMCSMLSVHRKLVCPGLGFRLSSRRDNLVPRAIFQSKLPVQRMLSGSFKFNNGGSSLMFSALAR